MRLTAGPWESFPRTPTASTTVWAQKYKCFSVSKTQGPTQRIAGNEAGRRDRWGVGHEYMNICLAPVSEFILRAMVGHWRVLRMGKAWSI